MLCSLSSDPDLLRSTLELTTVRGDVEFLKYLINSQGVDVNGE